MIRRGMINPLKLKISRYASHMTKINTCLDISLDLMQVKNKRNGIKQDYI